MLRFRERLGPVHGRRDSKWSLIAPLAPNASRRSPIVLRLLRFPRGKEEEQALGALYPIGLKAAGTARRLSKSGRPKVGQT
jgi:hypothetical protein